MLRLDAAGLTVRKGEHQILHNINLSLNGGELVALLGPSGSGKSTLLKALCGFQRGEGQVFIGNRNLYKEFDSLKTRLGYVPQDDLVHQALTVEAIVDYSARLRLPPDIPKSLRKAKVRSVMTALELEQRAGTKVKSLSGGQRKRVSVAVELLAEPPVLFLDEPTSGLDPALEESSMRLFRQLTTARRLTVVTTHVLSSLEFVDLIVFLNQGRLVYVGPPADVNAYFGVEHVLSVYKCLLPQKAQEQEAQFMQSSLYQRYVTERLLVPRADFSESWSGEGQNDQTAHSAMRLDQSEDAKREEPRSIKSTPDEILQKLKRERGKS